MVECILKWDLVYMGILDHFAGVGEMINSTNDKIKTVVFKNK
jgi:hypothetical protein